MDERIASLLRTGEYCAASGALSALRETLLAVNPQRSRAGGAPLAAASAAALLAALRADAAGFVHHAPPSHCAFKSAERHFRRAARVGGASAAIAAGAVDFSPAAAWRSAPSLSVRELCAASVVAALPGGICALAGKPGVYVLPGALSLREQELWARRALTDWIEPPNRRNIDGHVDPDVSTLAKFGESTLAPALRGTVGGGGGDGPAAATATAAPLPPASSPALQRGLWRGYCSSREERGAAPLRSALGDLSWATLGTQYDWTARVYHLPGDADYAAHVAARDARWHAEMPADVRAWGARIAAAVDAAARASLDGVPASAAAAAAAGLPMRLHAQAGIVNLYDSQRRSLPMGAHVDNMERDFSFPVVSASIGCAAVFLVGGDTKDEPPCALLLRSGDVVVFSGACRLAYHGVAATLPGTCPAALFAADAADGGETERAHFRSYVERHRINFNLRQIYADPEEEGR